MSATRILGGFFLTLAALRRLLRHARADASFPWRRVAALGLALWLLPALLVCSSFEYQNRIRWGMPQISIYIAFYGAGLMMASATACVLVRFPANRYRIVFTGLISILLTATLAMTYHANREATRYFARGWRDERLNMEAALRAGLAEEIPEHSTLILQHRYPWWHDRYVDYFYYQHTGKKLHFAGIPTGSPDLSPGRAIAIGFPDPAPPNGRMFVLLDGVRDQHSGYALLGSWDEASGSSPMEVRLFVRGQSRAEGVLPLISRSFATNHLKLVRQGDDWSLYLWPIDRDVLAGFLRGR